MTRPTPSKDVSNEEFEDFIHNKDIIYLAGYVFKKFRWARFSKDEKQELFLDAAHYTLQKWKPGKSKLTTYFCQNLRYKILDCLEYKRKHVHITLNNCIDNTISNFDEILEALPPLEKTVIDDFYQRSLNCSEIGEKLGVSVDKIYFLHKQGINRLKRVYNTLG